MSIDAISWAFEVDVRPASLKLILIALADNAGHDGCCYPSLKALEQKTSLDRKTIISGLDKLEENGLLADTGQREGATGQIKVYKLVGLDLGIEHYVYKISEPGTGRYYIGVRSCSGSANRDTSYMGSGTWPQLMAKCGAEMTKEVLCKYPDRKRANFAERSLIQEMKNDPFCMNSSKNGTVPKTHGNGSVFPTKEYRFSQVTVPKTEPGTVIGTIKEPSKEPAPSKSQTRKARETPFPDDLRLDQHLSAYALQHLPGVDAPELFESFKSKAIAKGWTYCDWRRALQEYIRNCAPNSGHWASGQYPRAKMNGSSFSRNAPA